MTRGGGRTFAALVVTGALLLAHGCGQPSGIHDASTAPSNGPAAGEQPPKASEPEQEAEASCTAALATPATRHTTRPLGRTYRYPDGLRVQLTDEHPDAVAPYASGAYPGEPSVLVTLHLSNSTRHGFSTTATQVRATYDEKKFDQLGSEIAQVEDSRTTTLPDPLPPTSSGTALLEFLVPNRCVPLLVFQVTLDTQHRSVTFVGASG